MSKWSRFKKHKITRLEVFFAICWLVIGIFGLFLAAYIEESLFTPLAQKRCADRGFVFESLVYHDHRGGKMLSGVDCRRPADLATTPNIRFNLFLDNDVANWLFITLYNVVFGVFGGFVFTVFLFKVGEDIKKRYVKAPIV